VLLFVLTVTSVSCDYELADIRPLPDAVRHYMYLQNLTVDNIFKVNPMIERLLSKTG